MCWIGTVFFELVLDGLLSLPPVLLHDLNMVVWHFWHVGFEKTKFTLDVLSELIHCKVSFIVSHPLLLAGGFSGAIALLFSLLSFHFFVSQTSLTITVWKAPGRLLDWPKIWQNITSDRQLRVCKHLAEHLMRSWLMSHRSPTEMAPLVIIARQRLLMS